MLREDELPIYHRMSDFLLYANVNTLCSSQHIAGRTIA